MYILQRTNWLIDAWHDSVICSEREPDVWQNVYKRSSNDPLPGPVVDKYDDPIRDPTYTEEAGDAVSKTHQDFDGQLRRSQRLKKNCSGGCKNPAHDPRDPPPGGGAGGAGSAGGSGTGSHHTGGSTRGGTGSSDNKRSAAEGSSGSSGSNKKPRQIANIIINLQVCSFSPF